VVIAPSLRGTSYEHLNGVPLRLPSDPKRRPSRKALDQHRLNVRF